MYLQNKDSAYDIMWNNEIKYGEIYLQNEIEQSKYNFEFSNPETLFKMFDLCENEALLCINNKIVLPAYDYTLKCSHTFNLLDARGVISKDGFPPLQKVRNDDKNERFREERIRTRCE